MGEVSSEAEKFVRYLLRHQDEQPFVFWSLLHKARKCFGKDLNVGDGRRLISELLEKKLLTRDRDKDGKVLYKLTETTNFS